MGQCKGRRISPLASRSSTLGHSSYLICGHRYTHAGCVERTLMPSSADRDGTMDMIFPTCSGVSSSTGAGIDCYINIAYNQQLPLCSLSTDSGLRKGVRVCRRPADLCIADPN